MTLADVDPVDRRLGRRGARARGRGRDGLRAPDRPRGASRAAATELSWCRPRPNIGSHRAPARRRARRGATPRRATARVVARRWRMSPRSSRPGGARRSRSARRPPPIGLVARRGSGSSRTPARRSPGCARWVSPSRWSPATAPAPRAPIAGAGRASTRCAPRSSPTEKVDGCDRARSPAPGVVFVGDGLNDAPALAAADGRGGRSARAPTSRSPPRTSTSSGSALTGVPDALELARRTYRVIQQNLFWAFAYNVVMIPLAVVGVLEPDVGGSRDGRFERQRRR